MLWLSVTKCKVALGLAVAVVLLYESVKVVVSWHRTTVRRRRRRNISAANLNRFYFSFSFIKTIVFTKEISNTQILGYGF